MRVFSVIPSARLGQLVLGALLVGSLLAAGCAQDTTGDDPDAEVDAVVDSGSTGDDTGGADVGDKDVGSVDSVAADTGPNEDCPGGPDCPCKTNAECDNAICLDTPKGKRCARNCVDSCPDASMVCAQVNSPGGDVVQICVPRWGKLCNPCSETKACESVGVKKATCVSGGDKGNFCGSSCASASDCPTGYKCQDVKSVEGVSVKQCVSASDECTCSESAKTEQLSTTCGIEVKDDKGGVIGKCVGQRKCLASGLSKCVAPEAKSEECDGVDNDCDGDTDEGTCDDKNPCTADACEPSKEKGKQCSHKKIDTGCNADDNICTTDDKCEDGVCTPGKKKPCDDKNPCTIDQCDAKKGCVQTDDDGNPCDDENPCTIGDVCQAGSCSAGKPKVCVSSDDCVAAKCNLVTGKCKFENQPDGLQCDDGTVCTKKDACKSGSCKGAVFTCDDANACTDDKCDPVKGCLFTPNNAPCDDGDKCTAGDVCKASACAGGKALECDDVNPCTADKCDAKTGKCTTTPNTASCSDDNACTVGDGCKNGKCAPGGAKSCDDNNACTTDSCDAADGSCNNVANDKPCDDGDPCTLKDTCKAKQCASGPARVCADKDGCTTDACDGKTGKCTFKPINGCGGNCVTAKDCEDKNACTANTCVGKKCSFPANTAPCNDGKKCTIGDLCKDGACKSGAGKNCDDGEVCTADSCDGKTGKCVNAPKTAPCNDGNACTLKDTCKGGKCAPGGKKSCDDKKLCTTDACNAKTGDCLHLANKLKCNDGNGCTVGDVCKGGKCAPGGPRDCNDSNGCTNDSCNPKTGACVHVPNTAPCSDGNACTLGDVCAKAKCKGGKLKNCNDGNPCTGDVCSKINGACNNAPQDGPCGDGNACTLKDTCVAGNCESGAAKVCNDKDACTADSCNVNTGACSSKPIFGCGGNCKTAKDCKDSNVCTNDTCKGGKCAFPPNTLGCSDGNACTVNDTCQAGKCGKGVKKTCDDFNPCTTDSCNAVTGKCTNANNTAKCTDDNVCTVGDKCGSGKCISGKKTNCNDGKLCTTDTCNAFSGDCENVANSLKCSDGNGCTIGDKCGGGACQPGVKQVCDDGKVCTSDLCDPKSGACKFVANTLVCSDGNACTIGDRCYATNCKAGKKRVCNDGKLCTTDSCNTKTGGCVYSNNTAKCSDGNACTLSDTCSAGKCKPGVAKLCNDGDKCTTDRCAPSTGACSASPIIGCGGNCKTVKDCNDNNVCTTDACTGGKCAFANNTLTCSDGKKCTVGDRCKAGTCIGGGAKNCSDGNVCTNDYCDAGTGGCKHVNNSNACNDGNVCTLTDRCGSGKCIGSGKRSCNDNKVCTTDSCNATKGCVFVNNTAACSDGNACTVGDKCGSGKCQKGKPKDCSDGKSCTDDFCLSGGKCYSQASKNGTVCAAGKGVCAYAKCEVKTYLSATALDPGYLHTCAIDTKGQVRCWGRNSSGECGDLSNKDRYIADKPVDSVKGAIYVDAGYRHSCAVDGNGVPWCWGANNYRQVSPSGSGSFTTPQKVALTDVVSLHLGWESSCATLKNATVWCWGRGSAGVLGNKSTATLTKPVQVANLTDVKGADMDQLSGCGSKKGQGYCWGQNTSFLFGIGKVLRYAAFEKSGFGAAVASMHMGSSAACALDTNGGVACAGSNYYGVMGSGATGSGNYAVTPVAVKLPPIASMDVSYFLAYAVTKEGDVWGWGKDNSGNMAQGSSTGKIYPPTQLTKLGKATLARASVFHGCLIRSDKSVWCWGSNSWGLLGNAITSGGKFYTPGRVVTSKTIVP